MRLNRLLLLLSTMMALSAVSVQAQLRQALDTVGSTLGELLSVFLTENGIFWWKFILIIFLYAVLYFPISKIVGDGHKGRTNIVTIALAIGIIAPIPDRLMEGIFGISGIFSAIIFLSPLIGLVFLSHSMTKDKNEGWAVHAFLLILWLLMWVYIIGVGDIVGEATPSISARFMGFASTVGILAALIGTIWSGMKMFGGKGISLGGGGSSASSDPDAAVRAEAAAAEKEKRIQEAAERTDAIMTQTAKDLTQLKDELDHLATEEITGILKHIKSNLIFNLKKALSSYDSLKHTPRANPALIQQVESNAINLVQEIMKYFGVAQKKIRDAIPPLQGDSDKLHNEITIFNSSVQESRDNIAAFLNSMRSLPKTRKTWTSQYKKASESHKRARGEYQLANIQAQGNLENEIALLEDASANIGKAIDSFPPAFKKTLTGRLLARDAVENLSQISSRNMKKMEKFTQSAESAMTQADKTKEQLKKSITQEESARVTLHNTLEKLNEIVDKMIEDGAKEAEEIANSAPERP
jgi:vacuolar-type H+-ATPase subunit H